MKPGKGSLGELFKADTQYQVPLYQRAYVWNEEDQWEPFWEDIQELLEGYLESKTIKKSHFMGSLVLEQKDSLPANEPQRWEVIDGQQRLTTSQVLFAALLWSVSTRASQVNTSLVNRLKKCLINEDFEAGFRYKMLPAHQDQPSFKALVMKALEGSEIPAEVQDSRLVQGFDYFVRKFDEWLADDATVESRFEAAFTVIHQGLVFILLTLEEGDSAQLIFETLNARGTPLLQADLVKNYILHQADLIDGSSAVIHREHWSAFEARDQAGDWWRAEVKVGRLMRTRLDAFLQFFVGLKQMSEVGPTAVFSAIKDLTPKHEKRPTSLSPRDLSAEIDRYGKIYFEMGHPKPGSREEQFFERLQILDFMTAFPLLLKLEELTRKDKAKYRAALDILESYLVRRVVCKLTPKSYNKTLYGLAMDLEPGDPVGSLREKLLSFEDETVVWPDDAAFRDALADQRFYHRITRARLRMLLVAINTHIQNQDNRAEAIPRPGLKPEVEHVLPQKWEENWSVPQEKAESRQRHVHQLGNLVLVTGTLNKKLSNLGWDLKKRELEKSAVFVTTRSILAGPWNEDLIEKRTAALADAAIEIWKHG